MAGIRDDDDDYFSALGFKADSGKDDRKLFFSNLIDHEVMCCQVGSGARSPLVLCTIVSHSGLSARPI